MRDNGMHADKNVAPRTTATSAEEAALRSPEIRIGRPLIRVIERPRP
jgi:hypothetical protein